jgi:hypothetical protein
MGMYYEKGGGGCVLITQPQAMQRALSVCVGGRGRGGGGC